MIFARLFKCFLGYAFNTHRLMLYLLCLLQELVRLWALHRCPTTCSAVWLYIARVWCLFGECTSQCLSRFVKVHRVNKWILAASQHLIVFLTSYSVRILFIVFDKLTFLARNSQVWLLHKCVSLLKVRGINLELLLIRASVMVKPQFECRLSVTILNFSILLPGLWICILISWAKTVCFSLLNCLFLLKHESRWHLATAWARFKVLEVLTARM